MSCAMELSVEMKVDLAHLQAAWGKFQQIREVGAHQTLEEILPMLTEDEKKYLLYLGLNSISEQVSKALHGMSAGEFINLFNKGSGESDG